jgi:hypothetical protein
MGEIETIAPDSVLEYKMVKKNKCIYIKFSFDYTE